MLDIPMNTSPPLVLGGGTSPTQTASMPPVQPPSGAAPIPASRGGVRLRKGQKTALVSPSGAGLTRIAAGLYWDMSPGYDLDAECFMLGADGRVIGDDWFVFYGATTSPDGAVCHSGDSQDGAASGDDEVITVDLARLDPRVERLIFVVTIDGAKERGLNFSGVRNAGMHIRDMASGADLVQFPLTEYHANVISMMVGEVYRHNGAWKFNPIGDGTGDDLRGLCMRYGVNVID